MALFVFDLDETLYVNEDFVQARFSEVYARLAKHLEISPKEAEERLQKKREESDAKKLPASYARLCEEMGLSREEYFEALDTPSPKKYVEFDQRTYDTIKALAEHHELVVYTNSPKKSSTEILEILKISEFFSAKYFARSFPQIKPYKPGVRIIFEKHDPRPIVTVGDNMDKDLLPWKEHKAMLIWVNVIEVADPRVHAVIRDVGELLDVEEVKELQPPKPPN